jgi:multidrug efflux system membrane fusion protein
MKRSLLGLIVLSIVFVSGCGKPAAQGGFQMPPPLVTVSAAVSRDVPLYLDEIGTCAALQFVSITPQVTGPIIERHFDDGADVHKGDLLFKIDPRPYQAALDQAISNQQQMAASVQYSKIALDRMAGLLPTKAVSQDDFDKMKNNYDQADAQREAAKAAVELAKLNLEYCTITSPVDGRVGQRLVDVGNVVTANQGSLVVIQTLDPIYADFTIAEGDLPTVRQHSAAGTLKVQVKLPGDEGDGQLGDLTFIDTQVQDQAGRVKLRATLPNPDRHFWPGQFVNVRLILSLVKDAVLVPVAAEQAGQAGPFVYVVKADSTAELRPVTLGEREGDMIVVEHGVAAGENVITNGQMTVIPGGPVHVEAPATQPANAMAEGTP